MCAAPIRHSLGKVELRWEKIKPWSVAVVATLAMSVSYMDRQALAAIAPTVREELHISRTEFGWLASVFAAAYLVGAPIAGKLTDRFGPRRVLASAVVIWSIVGACHALASTFLALVVLRLALGLAEAPTYPAAAQTVQRVLPVSKRALGMGLLFTGSSFGAMVAAPLAVRLAKDHGFRFAFFGTAAVGLLWLPLWLLATRNLPVTPADSQAISEKKPHPLGVLLTHRAVLRQAVLVMLSAPAMTLILNWFPQILVETEGVAKENVGHYLWLPPLLFDICAISFGAAGSALDKRHPGRPHLGLMLLAAGLTCLLAVIPWVHGAWIRVALAALSMAGGGGIYVLGSAELLNRVGIRNGGLASGISAAVQSLVQIVVSPAIGASVDHTHSWTVALVVLGGIAPLGIALWSQIPTNNTANWGASHTV